MPWFSLLCAVRSVFFGLAQQDYMTCHETEVHQGIALTQGNRQALAKSGEPASLQVSVQQSPGAWKETGSEDIYELIVFPRW